MRTPLATAVVVMLCLAIFSPTLCLAQRKGKPKLVPVGVMANGTMFDPQTGQKVDHRFSPFARYPKSKKRIERGMMTKRPPLMLLPADMLHRKPTRQELAVYGSYLRTELKVVRNRGKKNSNSSAASTSQSKTEREFKIWADQTAFQTMTPYGQQTTALAGLTAEMVQGDFRLQFQPKAGQVVWTTKDPAIATGNGNVINAGAVDGSTELVANLIVGGKTVASTGPIVVTVKIPAPTGVVAKVRKVVSGYFNAQWLMLSNTSPQLAPDVLTFSVIFLLTLAFLFALAKRLRRRPNKNLSINPAQASGQQPARPKRQIRLKFDPPTWKDFGFFLSDLGRPMIWVVRRMRRNKSAAKSTIVGAAQVPGPNQPAPSQHP